MKTLVGVMMIVVASLLASVTVTPPGGAGAPKVIGNWAIVPSAKLRPACRPIAADVTTVMFAVVSGSAVPELAWITVAPGPVLVTGTLKLVEPATIVRLGGTPATAGLLELNVTFNPPAGAGVAIVSNRY